MADYRKKIRDLLALSESPNEHEAKAALLKARELMAKYKISELDRPVFSQEVIRQLSGIDYSMRRDPWIAPLGTIIAEHHCCQCFQIRRKGKQVAEIAFIGFKDDLLICLEVFQYAVNCIRSTTKELRKKQNVSAADGYGYGFTLGLKESYEKQQKEEKWELILAIPDAVKNEMKQISQARSKKADHKKKLENTNARSFIRGLNDGRKFDMRKYIQDNEKPVLN